MKAEELRIGNLVDTIDGVKKVLQLLQLENKGEVGVKYVEGIQSTTTLLFNPIPLTEEWLLKFGFKKDSDGEYIDSDFNISLTYANELKTEWYDNNLCVDVLHVHQLQNLYFALTEKELKGRYMIEKP